MYNALQNTKLMTRTGLATLPFKVGTAVFWNVKDAAYGMRGRVLGQSEFYEETCVVVQFKGHPYHCKASSLELADPKRLRRARLAAQPVFFKSGAEPAWTETDNTISANDSPCQMSSHSLTSSADRGKTRAYGRSQAASRYNRLLSRRSHRQRCREAKLAEQEAHRQRIDSASDFLRSAVDH